MDRSRKTSRRLVVAVAASTVLALGACGGGDDPGGSTGPAGDGSIEGQTIRMINVEGASGRLLEEAIALFEAETGASIEYASLGINEAIDQQILGLSSGSDQFDVVLAESGYMNMFANGMAPLDDRLAADDLISEESFIGPMIDLFRMDGTLYALPVRVGGRVLIYNETLLSAAGYDAPPETSEEFLEIAQAVTDGTTFGYSGTLQQGNYLATQWTPWVRSFGSDILDENLECAAFNDENGRAATEFFVSLYRDHQVMPPDSIEFENGALIGDMQIGRSAMAIGYSGWFGEMTDPEVSQTTDDLRIAPNLPHGPNADHGVTDLGGWGLGINSNSSPEAQEVAWQFARFVASPEVQLQLAIEHGNAPTLTSVFESAEYNEAVPDAPNMLSTFATGARQRPLTESYGEIEAVLARYISQALIGDLEPAEALDQAEAEVNGLLNGSC